MGKSIENHSFSKSISLRIWEDNLLMLNYLVELYASGLSRSFVINKILNTILTCTPAHQIQDMLNTMFPSDKCFRIDFKRDEDLLRKKREELLK